MKLLQGLLLAAGLLGAGPALAHSYSGDVRVILPRPAVQVGDDTGPAYHGHGHRAHREVRRAHRRHHRHEHCESAHRRDAHHRHRHFHGPRRHGRR